MSIDWKKERDLTWRIWKWWFRTGLLAIPFGLIYGAGSQHNPAHEKAIFWVCIVGMLVTNYVIQGPPPME